MPRVEAIRSEVMRLRKANPFRPFILNLENGTPVIIGRPENIAFDPPTPQGTGGSDEFYVLSSQLRMLSTFDAVTSVSVID